MKRLLLASIAGLVLFQMNYVSAAYNGADNLGPQSISADPSEKYKTQGMIDAEYVFEHTRYSYFWQACQHAKNMIGEMDKLNRTAPGKVVADYRNGIRSVSENLWCMVTREPFKGLELKLYEKEDSEAEKVEKQAYNDALMVCHAILHGDQILAKYRGDQAVVAYNHYKDLRNKTGIAANNKNFESYCKGLIDGYRIGFGYAKK